MNLGRIWHSAMLCLKPKGLGRAEYIRKHHIFHHVGNHCMVMFRKIPLYPELISLGENVWIASGVLLVTHDAIHEMLNYCTEGGEFRENIGCIDIRDNVFIGSGSTVLPGVTIGPNTIIGAETLVNKSLPGNGVYAGVPAKYICSFESFVQKRRRLSGPGAKGLTEKTVLELWKAHNNREKEKNRMQEENA